MSSARAWRLFHPSGKRPEVVRVMRLLLYSFLDGSAWRRPHGRRRESFSSQPARSTGSAMNSISKLSRERAALAVIDMQEAFRVVIPDFSEVASRIAKAVEGARLLEVPVIVTEQYPKGLKHTAKEILARLPDELKAIEKSCFSSCGAQDFLAQLRGGNITQVLVCGIEA